jgi:NADPH2:quinone reductase
MAKAIRFHETGTPEVLKLEDVEVGDPGPGQARVRHSYIALNFIDIYFRTGRYPLALPNGLGSDAVGVVEAVGPGVTDIRVGDRVGYLIGPQGAYSQVRVMPAEVLIPLPDGVPDRTAATLMMKGMTAQYLFRQVFPLQGGETILYHAAAGGVGLIACQWARAMGVTMIGTVSTDEKAELAKANGCAHTIVTSREDIVQRVKDITGGKGVPVVYDSVGKDTLAASLDCLQPRGSLVSNGTSSGPVVIDSQMLAAKGSGSRGRRWRTTSSRGPTCWTWPASSSTTCWPDASSASPSRCSRWRMRPRPIARSSRARPPDRRSWCPDPPAT